MENRKKVLNLLGLATRAGKTASGEFMTEKAIKSGKAYLVIVSEEASDNTKKMFVRDMADVHAVNHVIENVDDLCGNCRERQFKKKRPDRRTAEISFTG